jgi:precorrin-6Y C5,15-methyltransferase (decarboxylating)
MSPPVAILGMGADGLSGLSARAREAIASATFLAGGRRHLELVRANPAETYTIANNLGDLAARLAARGPDERCVVLASGDPLFFGIGHYLGEALGRDQIAVEPAVSSMQLAFARAGLSWHDAAIASVHGRPLESALLPLLGRPKIGLFTQDGDGPSAVAGFFVDRGLADYDTCVAEDLGSTAERVVACPIADLIGRRFGPLNVVLLLRRPAERALPSCPVGLPDDLFARPETGPMLLSHADVRAVTLARFRDVPAGPLWDVGAGLGGMAVELARAFPGAEVVAVERSPERASYLRANRERLGAYNIRVVEGEAPGCLAGEPTPSAVFLGGSGGRLGPILDLAIARLAAGGVLVANFVGLENLSHALGQLKDTGWSPEVAQVQVSRSEPLAGLTTFVPQRPVWIVRAARPGRTAT